MHKIREIEFIMVSETNFEKLELLEKDETAIEEQVYEKVEGFEDLDSKVQTRTTAFSCKKENENYDESFLMSRPLPWVVRVYFKMEDSMKGILCSGMGTFILPICIILYDSYIIWFETVHYDSIIFQQLSSIISGW